MDATVLDGDEELLSWHVDSEWAMAYHTTSSRWTT